ncbi:hypothetical protein [Sphingorhabdus sp. Alg239-R122]|uniref:hypothetical protein n=1 Tax=Sphingorhabdus sp. Alg239-R122 TaxID=2305989 RepID=UPI0013DA85AD|nr:hypothetical protein [Sphingorhabdus sp. Alg239-R122]
MSKPKFIWATLLALLYGSFWIWYGGNGDPISEEEGKKMLAQIEQVHGVKLEDTPEGSMSRNLLAMLPNDDGREFYAVNLETRNKGAKAAEAEARYAEIVIPLLLERGGHPVFLSERAGLMLGKYGERIDRVAVVRYRSLRDLLDMLRDERMVEGNKYKTASLTHTEVFITRPTITFAQVRFTLGMLFLILGFARWKLIDWRQNRIQEANAGA